MQFFYIADLLVNLDNVVAFDEDKGEIQRIWYRGSDKPIPLHKPVPAGPVAKFLKDRGLLV